jgi:sulfur carrier protein
MVMSRMTITINGESREVAAGMTVAELLAELGLDRQACAVEVNLAIVPKRRHDSHALAEGDRLEVVTLVGGG